MRKFTSACFCVFLSFGIARAQLLYNNGADMAVSGGGVLFVDGAVENANSGFLSNAGQTTIRGFFRNGSLATGGGTNGEYIVFGDWENNNTFTADQSLVRLRGAAQLITGSSVTSFYDLALENGSVKTQTLDANTTHLLSLGTSELATTDFKMTVTNTSPAAITRLSGFVSSTGPGRLVRYTNAVDLYGFPTGWNDNGTVYYRPVEIKPSVSDAQNFEVRMGYGDATAEGYDISNKAGDVSVVNAKFFHLVKQIGSIEPSELSIYYLPAKDSTWNSIGRWEPQWQDLKEVVINQGAPYFHNTKKLWADNGNEPHILINAKEAEVLFNFPNVFTPDGNGVNDFFGIINQLNLVTLEELKVFNRWGEPVFDSQRDGKKDWDGKYQGQVQLMGNYVYEAQVKVNSTGEIKSARGNLSLLW